MTFTFHFMLVTVLLGLLALILTLFCLFVIYASVLLFWYKAPLIPTDKKIYREMVALGGLSKDQTVYDLGCGFGGILFHAFKKYPKNKYIGYEILKPVVWLNKYRAKVLRQDVTFHDTDFFNADISDADVIFMYLWDTLMARFYKEKYKSLKPGTKIISHGFPIKSLTPEKIIKVGRAKLYQYTKT